MIVHGVFFFGYPWRKIIRPGIRATPRKLRFPFKSGDDPSQRIRIVNTLIDAMGEEVALKKGAAVHFVIRPKPRPQIRRAILASESMSRPYSVGGGGFGDDAATKAAKQAARERGSMIRNAAKEALRDQKAESRPPVEYPLRRGRDF